MPPHASACPTSPHVPPHVAPHMPCPVRRLAGHTLSGAAVMLGSIKVNGEECNSERMRRLSGFVHQARPQGRGLGALRAHTYFVMVDGRLGGC